MPLRSRLAQPPAWKDLFDLTQTRSCIAAFLVIAVPTLIALCLIIGPFQTLDEAPHFYRSVQLSMGHVLPTPSPTHDAAGDALDTTVHRLGRYYQYLTYTRGKTTFGSSKADFRAAASDPLMGRREFTPFSNTVIYFPLAHAAPAAAIAVLRAFHATPLQWLYAGRLLNAALAVGIFCLTIGWFPAGRLFVFVLALAPRTLFTTVSLSPDALLIPISALFGALTWRLAVDEELTTAQYAWLIFATFFIAVCKLAYVPLVAIPPAVALIAARRVSRASVILAISGALTIATWLGWMLMIRGDVYSIRPGVNVQVYGQLHHVLTAPLHFIGVLIATLRKSTLYYLDIMIGGGLGAETAAVPKALAILTYPVLVVAAVIACVRSPWRPGPLLVSAFFVTGVVGAVFLLLYMQYTALDARVVEGVQGRYFLPLLPVLIAFLPKFRIGRPWITGLSVATFAWMAIMSGETLHLMKVRYWDTTDASAPRYLGFSHADME